MYRNRKKIVSKKAYRRAGTDDRPRASLLVFDVIQNGERRSLICFYRLILLDLNRIKNTVFLNDQINLRFSFFFIIFPPVIGDALAIVNSSVGIGLEDF